MSVVASYLTILPSASRADTTGPDVITGGKFRGGDFFIDQTAQGSTTAFVTVKIQGKIPATTQYYTIATVTPTTVATWTKRVRIYPGASTALNSTGLDPTVLNEFLPPVFRVTSTNASTSAVTFSVSANLFA